jgi:hypothetical protein
MQITQVSLFLFFDPCPLQWQRIPGRQLHTSGSCEQCFTGVSHLVQLDAHLRHLYTLLSCLRSWSYFHKWPQKHLLLLAVLRTEASTRSCLMSALPSNHAPCSVLVFKILEYHFLCEPHTLHWRTDRASSKSYTQANGTLKWMWEPLHGRRELTVLPRNNKVRNIRTTFLARNWAEWELERMVTPTVWYIYSLWKEEGS